MLVALLRFAVIPMCAWNLYNFHYFAVCYSFLALGIQTMDLAGITFRLSPQRCVTAKVIIRLNHMMAIDMRRVTPRV